MLLHRPRRDGISLLEVILALAIFLLSITGLVSLMGVASNHALEAQMRSGAISIAQSRLAEVSAGVISLEGHPQSTCDDDNDYKWSMDVESGSYNGLSNVTVTVTRKRANGTEMECSLSQMVFDPKSVGTVFDSAQDPDTSTASNSGASGSSSTASSSSSSPAAATPAATAAPKTSAPAAPSTSAPKAGPSTSAPKAGPSTSRPATNSGSKSSDPR